MKQLLIYTLLILLSLTKLSAQSNTVTAGGEATGSGGNGSFTAGEVFYTSKSGSTGSVTEGMQQTDPIILFNANGGAGTMSNQFIAYLASANLITNTFTRAGYTFAGWATTVTGTVAYPDGAIYTMTDVEDVTLYASWTANYTLGDYVATFLPNAGGNTTVSPDAAPTGGASLTAYTTTDFKGLFTVDQSTGVVAITNAHPAGTYGVTVDAGFGITKAFTLTVSNTLCSQGQFYAPDIPELSVGINPSSVAIGDFNGDDIQDIAIGNSSNNLTGPSVFIWMGDGLGGFSYTTEVVVGYNSVSIAVGDFNGDGNQDIAATTYANSTGAGSVAIRLGNGQGGFSGSTEVAVGNSPYSIATGDFNGDGKQDIATANLNSNSVSIRLGDGQGGFTGDAEVPVGSYPTEVSIGDFNGDGNQDIAAANYISNSVSIRLGDGQGGFSGATEVPTGPDSNPVSIGIGDFNGDGKQDIATGNFDNFPPVSIRLGDGLGGFSGTNFFISTYFGGSIAIGEFNGDGNQDIAYTSHFQGKAFIRLGNGMGGFSGTNEIVLGPYNGGSFMNKLAIGDFNGDGLQDIAAVNANYSGTVSIRLGAPVDYKLVSNGIDIPNGNTSISTADNTDFGSGFTITKTFTIQNTGTGLLNINTIDISGADAALFAKSGITLPATIAAGGETTFNLNYNSTSLGTKTVTVTINKDDCDEVAYAFNIQATSLSPTLGNYAAETLPTAGGNATITPTAAPNVNLGLTATTTDDFKGKLTVDDVTGAVIITNAHPAGTYQITVNAGFGVSETFTLTVGNTLCNQGQFLSSTSLNVGANPGFSEVADFNNDGHQDMALALNATKAVSIQIGDGSGSFTTVTPLTFIEAISRINTNDFNGDGNADILVKGSNSIYVRLGNGLGAFTLGATIYYNSIGSMTAILSEDFDQDGKMDFVVSGGSGFGVFKGNGQGGFSLLNTYNNGINLNFTVKGDFNGDGFTDLSMGNPPSGDNYIYFGDGLGGFGSSTIYNLDPLIRFSTVSDFDGDGKSDILSALGNTPGTVAFQRNNGDGTFATPTYIAVGDNPVSIVSGDFNGDGNLDFATGNPTLSTLSVRYGNGDGTFYGSIELLTNAPAPASSLNLILGDFNEDGIHDIGSANNTTSTDDFSIFLGASNEINLQGNAVNIVSGDSSPDAADDTDFGVVVLNNPTTKTYTIQNTGTGDLIVSSIDISGTDAALFSIGDIILPATIAAVSSTTFTVTLTTGTSGIKTATITITSDDCDESAYTFSVKGKDNSFVVSFDANSGTGTMSAQTIVYNASANLTPSTFNRIGYNFAGWATTTTGTVAYADGASYTMSGAADVTLYAQWTLIVAPEAPVNLVATVPCDDQIEINFTAGADGGSPITNYEYTLDGTMWTAFSPAVTGTTVTVTSLSNGTYNINLRAVNSVGIGVTSTTVTATIYTNVSITYTGVTIVTATNKSASITLSTTVTLPVGADVTQSKVRFINRNTGQPISGWETITAGVQPNTGSASYGPHTLTLGTYEIFRKFKIGIEVGDSGCFTRNEVADDVLVTMAEPGCGCLGTD